MLFIQHLVKCIHVLELILKWFIFNSFATIFMAFGLALKRDGFPCTAETKTK